MRSIPVDTRRFSFIAVSVGPKIGQDDKGNRVQKVERDTQHLGWAVSTLAIIDGDKPEVIEVTVFAPVAPALPELSPIEFGNLGARPWNMGDNNGTAFSADSVRVVTNSMKANGTKADVPVLS